MSDALSSVDGVIPFGEEPPSLGALPNRYTVKEEDKNRYITCVEAPNLSLRVERDFTVSASGAHKYAEGSIFLDGAAQAEPFMDVKRKVYNLDHHEGCVRSFTLSTCEQAMIVVLKGLDLNEGDWTLYGNDPDLDTVLAAWVLLNHARLTEDGELRRRLMPLLRVQGVIDAHGLEMLEISGLPDHLQDEMVAVINVLRRDEVEIKKSGKWQSTDLLEYTASVLRAIDNVVYSPGHFEDLRDVEEIGRFPVSSNRIGVICRSDIGVYEVEEYLKKLHKDRIGLLVLQKDPSTYTVRLVDSFLHESLDPLYDRLNQLEPNLSKGQRWGGSSDIGGSPRGTGTALDPSQIAAIGEWVYRSTPLRQRLAAVAKTSALGLVGVVAALLVAFSGLPETPLLGTMSSAAPRQQLIFGAALAAAAMVLLIPLLGSRRRAQAGLRLPLGIGWLGLLPALLVAAVARGGWGPPPPPSDALGWAGLVAGAVAAEAMFRGAIHGKLMARFRVVRPGGTWRLSIPNVVSALVYCVVVVTVFYVPLSGAGTDVVLWEVAIMAAAAFVVGVTCGLARERTGSLVAPAALHVISIALVSTGALLLS